MLTLINRTFVKINSADFKLAKPSKYGVKKANSSGSTTRSKEMESVGADSYLCLPIPFQLLS